MTKNLYSISLCVICGICASNLHAATPRDELLKLVPVDAGFVFVVQDLRGHLGRLQSGPFAKRFLQTAPGKALLEEKATKDIAAADKELAKEIGIGWAKLRDDLIGDAVVFVYRPGPVDHPAAEEGIVLLHARDPATAENVLKHLDESQTKSGKLKSVAELQHAGRNFHKRVRQDEPEEFQYHRGNLVAFGNAERLMKQIIDADADSPAAEPDLTKKLNDLKIGSAAAVWWINPRAFDAGIAAKKREAKGGDAVALAAFERHWKALDGAALFLDPATDVKVGLALSARPDALPGATRVLLSELAKPCALLSSFPDDALLTIAGRLAMPSLLETVASFLPDQARAELHVATKRSAGAAFGTDLLSNLPKHLGPDWGLCVTAPASGDANRLPEVTAAVRLEETSPPVAPRVLDGVHALATLAAVGYNFHHADPITPRTMQQGDVEVRYFVNDAAFPTGLQPAFAWKGGFLVFASSPDAVKKFNPPTGVPAASGETPLLRLALRGWTNYLRDRKADAAKFVAVQQGIGVEPAALQIDEALKLLELFDGLDVSLRSDTGRATLTLRLRTTAAVE